jgi:hypothetical protein
VPIILPSQFAPTSIIYVKVDLCGANNGRLAIAADGPSASRRWTE